MNQDYWLLLILASVAVTLACWFASQLERERGIVIGTRVLLHDAQDEIARLKRGDFTPAELQSLCRHRHEREGCTREDVEQGCREYQEKIFGKADPS